MTPLEDMAQRMHHLVAMSPVRARLLQCLSQEDPDTVQITEWVEKDPAIAARVLRLANSPFFGLPHEVESIAHAVSLVGLRSLQSLALAAAVMEQFKTTDPALESAHRAHWRHSVAVAVCAQGLARKVRVAVDTAFTAGLLHNLGRLVMLTIDPARQWKVREQCRQALGVAENAVDVEALRLQTEQAVWGFDHGQVGEMLARHWQLPESLRRCMALHHRCDDPEANTLVWLVHVAHSLAHALDLLQEPEDQVPVIQAAAWEGLRLDWSDSRSLLSGIEERYQLACQQLMS